MLLQEALLGPKKRFTSFTTSDKAVLVLLPFLFVALLFIAMKVVPLVRCAVDSTIYPEMAQTLLSGQLPRDDEYHPLFYPLIGAFLGRILGDVLVALRFVSVLSGVFFAFLFYILGKRYFDESAAFCSLLLVIFNFYFIQASVSALSDATFCVFLYGVLIVLVETNEKNLFKNTWILAALFSFAYFTKHPAIFLAPVIALHVFYLRKATFSNKLLVFLTFVAAFFLFSLPNFFLTYRQFGSPFHSLHWAEMLRRVYSERYGFVCWGCDKDPSLPFRGYWDVISSYPWDILVATLKSGVNYFRVYIFEQLGPPPVGGLLAVTFLMGMYDHFFSGNSKKTVVFLFIVFYVLMVSISHFPSSHRVMLPILPLATLIALDFLKTRVFPGSWKIGDYEFNQFIPIVLLLLAVLLVTIPSSLDGFVKNRPIKEMQTVIRLEKEHGAGIVIMGTIFGPKTYVSHYHLLRSSSLQECFKPAKYYDYLYETANRLKADYVIFSRFGMMDGVPAALYEGVGVPSFLEPIERGDGIVVYKVRLDRSFDGANWQDKLPQ